MKLLILSVQSYDKDDNLILWTVDVNTTLLIKAHLSQNLLLEYKVGDCIEIESYSKFLRQEVWVRKCKRIPGDFRSVLEESLELKSATPYSLLHPNYIGNVAKIKEIISINKNEIVANLYGFPKENLYLQIHDLKWNNYMKHNKDETNFEQLICSVLNSLNNKYIIIDFIDVFQRGSIQVAAMVVL